MWQYHLRTRLIASVVAAVLLAGGCGGSDSSGSGGKTTITFANWAAAETTTQPGIQQLIERFEADNPDVDVVSEPVSFSDVAHQTLLQAQAREAPDVVQIAGNDMLSLAEAGILEPLGEHAGQSYQDSVIPEVLELGQVDGELLAVPWAVTPFGFWYNKKILAKAGLDPETPPATMDDLLAAMAALNAKVPGAIPIGLDTTNRSFGLDVNWSFMRAFDAEPFEADGAAADSPGMRDYLQFVRTLADRKYTEINKKLGEFRPLAADGRVAFMWDGPYLKNTMQVTNHMPDAEFFETWGVTSLPSGAGEVTSVPTDHQLAMTAQSANKDAAWRFIEFLSTSDQGMNYTVTTTGGLPPVAEPPASLAAQLDNPVVRAFREQVIPVVGRPPWGEGYGKAYSPVMAGVQSAMTTDASLDDVAKQMQSQLETALR